MYMYYLRSEPGFKLVHQYWEQVQMGDPNGLVICLRVATNYCVVTSSLGEHHTALELIKLSAKKCQILGMVHSII